MNNGIDLNIFDNSKFRMKFKLSAQDCSYISKNELGLIEKHAKEFVLGRLAQATPDKDGKQTPFKGHPVFKAQHATATCCRGCLEKWHKIRKGKSLSVEEVDYVVSFIMLWIKHQLSIEIPRSRKPSRIAQQLTLFNDLSS